MYKRQVLGVFGSGGIPDIRATLIADFENDPDTAAAAEAMIGSTTN